ncbi:MAG: SDR family oxidoreductase [Candidatus Nanopelagicales bacterium]|nr:SDR family oxidoreductase [Candidatus Nanopelagicales bacterium]
MRVLISGANGLLGQHLIRSRSREAEILGIVRSRDSTGSRGEYETRELDLTQFSEVIQVLDTFAPEVIIHTAAEGRVDAVQKRIDEFRALNVELPSLLSEYAKNSGAQIVHLSSNAVFGGGAESYSDYSRFDPINGYGVLKAEAEKSVIEQNPNALVVRPILMYGWPQPSGRQNPVTSWISSLREGKMIRVVDDVWTEPLAAWDCAEAIWCALDERMSGPLNVSGGVKMSLFEFAHAVASVFDLDSSLIDPASSGDFPTLAPRPRSTSFDLRRLKEELDFYPSSPMEGLEKLKRDESAIAH